RNLYRMANTGKLPGVFKVGLRWAMRPEALDAWLAKQEAQHTSPMPAVRDHHQPQPSSPTHRASIFSEAYSALERALKNLDMLRGQAAQVIAGSITNGISAIYSPRRSLPLEGPSANEAIADLLHRATGLVLLQGTTLRAFFHDQLLRRILAQKLQERSIRV